MVTFFKALFPSISGDLTVEQKGKDGFIIPAEAKPKFGATTNYVPPGSGESFRRRIHIVEFGDYWNRASKKGIFPKDIIGKNLPADINDRIFSDEDWNDTFQYIFSNMQTYLRDGLKANNSSAFLKRQRARNQDGGAAFCDWAEKWINEDRIDGDYHKDGIPVDDFLSHFAMDLDQHNLPWDKTRLLDAFFDYCKKTSDVTYNPDHIQDGDRDTRTQRRWRVGSRGQQQDWIKIVKEKDPS